MSAAEFAIAFAGCAALAATMPLAAARSVPAPVRGALALAIVPLAVSHEPRPVPDGTDVLWHMLSAAAFGAMFGLTSAAIAAAASSAGALIDAAFAAPPSGVDPTSGQTAGPFASLFALAYAVALTKSGALTALIATFAWSWGQASSHFPVSGAAQLGTSLFALALTCALPALGAHALATLVAGAAARAGARINGMLLAPALSACAVLVAVAAGSSALWFALERIAQLTVRATHAL